MTKETTVLPSKDETIRLATMNILNTARVFTERMVAITDQLRELQPDILSFQEAIFSAEGKDLDDVQRCADALGMTLLVGAAPVPHPTKDLTFTNVTLVSSRVQVIGSESVILRSQHGTGTHPSITQTHLKVNGRLVVIFNAHLPWGSANEPARLTCALQVSEIAAEILQQDPSAIIYFNGDFNTEPDSDTLRYLRSKHVLPGDKTTLWVDAWLMFHAEHEDGHTSRNDGAEAIETALGVGIAMPHLLPRRRIDYILGYGWIYGRPGTPLNIERFGFGQTPSGRALSDHYGLYSDVWIPSV